jgi:hypothetical protein
MTRRDETRVVETEIEIEIAVEVEIEIEIKIKIEIEVEVTVEGTEECWRRQRLDWIGLMTYDSLCTISTIVTFF